MVHQGLRLPDCEPELDREALCFIPQITEAVCHQACQADQFANSFLSDGTWARLNGMISSGKFIFLALRHSKDWILESHA